MRVAQHRGLQKKYLRQRGFPVVPFVEISSLRMLCEALQGFKTPAVLKAAQAGCGGRRQFLIHSPLQAEEAWAAIGRRPSVLEKWIDIHRELTVVVVHSPSGEIMTYGPIQSTYHRGLLDASASPAELPRWMTDRTIQLARDIACRLDVIGVLCVEMFLTDDYELLVNQLVPRLHDSGHLTLNAHVTSQFEQLVRAICGLPLGPGNQLRPAATVGLRGDRGGMVSQTGQRRSRSQEPISTFMGSGFLSQVGGWGTSPPWPESRGRRWPARSLLGRPCGPCLSSACEPLGF